MAGIVPLLAYLLPAFQHAQFVAATILALAALFTVGAGVRSSQAAVGLSLAWKCSSLERLLAR